MSNALRLFSGTAAPSNASTDSGRSRPVQAMTASAKPHTRKHVQIARVDLGKALPKSRSVAVRGLFDSMAEALGGNPAEKTRQRFQPRVDKINAMEKSMEVRFMYSLSCHPIDIYLVRRGGRWWTAPLSHDHIIRRSNIPLPGPPPRRSKKAQLVSHFPCVPQPPPPLSYSRSSRTRSSAR